MTFHEHLLVETAPARDRFLAIPLIRSAIAEGVERDLYLRFLGQAYHHVRQTCSLFERAIGACRSDDGILSTALGEYIEEERGHDQWILDDIADLGGDAESVRASKPGVACAVMCGYAYVLIDQLGPYAILGMVHVLEGMSVALAHMAAESIRGRLGSDGDRGFRYLTSHGELDRKHVDYFARLIDTIEDERHRQSVIDSARTFYRLYGNIFRELAETETESHA